MEKSVLCSFINVRIAHDHNPPGDIELRDRGEKTLRRGRHSSTSTGLLRIIGAGPCDRYIGRSGEALAASEVGGLAQLGRERCGRGGAEIKRIAMGVAQGDHSRTLGESGRGIEKKTILVTRGFTTIMCVKHSSTVPTHLPCMSCIITKCFFAHALQTPDVLDEESTTADSSRTTLLSGSSGTPLRQTFASDPALFLQLDAPSDSLLYSSQVLY